MDTGPMEEKNIPADQIFCVLCLQNSVATSYITIWETATTQAMAEAMNVGDIQKEIKMRKHKASIKTESSCLIMLSFHNKTLLHPDTRF